MQKRPLVSKHNKALTMDIIRGMYSNDTNVYEAEFEGLQIVGKVSWKKYT